MTVLSISLREKSVTVILLGGDVFNESRPLAVPVLSGLMVAGCSTHYYRVTRPGIGETYYTNNIERVWQGGALNFKDVQSGTSVTLQNSEVKELSEDEFMASLALNQPFEADC